MSVIGDRVSEIDTQLIRERYQNISIEGKEAALGYGLVLPAIIVVGLIIIYPLAYNFWLSLHTIPLDPNASLEWVGLQHYRTIFGSSEYWSSLTTTVIYTLASDVIATTAGLAVALLLNRQFRGERAVRSLVFLPYIAPVIAVAFTWRWELNPLRGYLPYLLSDRLHLIGEVGILNASGLAIWGTVAFAAWRYFPFAYLFLIARLQAIDDSLYEAAKLDGASKFAQFKDITLPELKSALAIVFLIRWIWQFNVFADVWLLTRKVTTLAIFTYQTAFASFERGLGAAISLTMFGFLVLFLLGYSYFAFGDEADQAVA